MRVATEEQSDGFDKDRLPRARLAGEDVQARPKFHLGSVNNGEMGDTQEAKHGASGKREKSSR